MHLELLRRFVAVAQTLSFRQAASQLGMTQPPLSLKLVASGAGVGFIPAMFIFQAEDGIRYAAVQDDSFNVEIQLDMIWIERKAPEILLNFVKSVSEATVNDQKDRGTIPRKSHAKDPKG